MLTKKNSAKEVTASDSCTVWEYGGGDALDLARAKITGRYPEKGKSRNRVSTMIYYVLFGSGRVNIEGKDFLLEEGDSLLIEPGKAYFVEGNLEVLMPSAPAWSLGQYEHID